MEDKNSRLTVTFVTGRKGGIMATLSGKIILLEKTSPRSKEVENKQKSEVEILHEGKTFIIVKPIKPVQETKIESSRRGIREEFFHHINRNKKHRRNDDYSDQNPM